MSKTTSYIEEDDFYILMDEEGYIFMDFEVDNQVSKIYYTDFSYMEQFWHDHNPERLEIMILKHDRLKDFKVTKVSSEVTSIYRIG